MSTELIIHFRPNFTHWWAFYVLLCVSYQSLEETGAILHKKLQN